MTAVAEQAGVVTVRVLGPVQLIGPDGREVDLPSATQRRLLGVLAIHSPDAVRSSWLCQVLDVTPGALRTSIARLRRLLGERTLRTATGGYRLDADVDARLACDEIDAADGDPDRLTSALARWVGPALTEFGDEAWAVGAARRLDEVRAAAVEDLAELRLANGDFDRAIQELERHARAHPYRDRPRGLLMRALAASGRQTEALRAFQDYRRSLSEDVGTEPTDELYVLDRRIAEGWRGVDVLARPTGSSVSRPTADLDDDLRLAAAGVGRRSTLDQLEAVADDVVVEGGLRVVLISGEVGIGKTTLVAELARSFTATGAFVVHYGRCDEIVGSPYQPFASIIDRILDHLPDVDRSAHAARHGGDVTRLLPWRAPSIGAPPTRTSDERTARLLLFDAVADVVRRAAIVGPAVIAIDDMQWAEPGAVHLLRHLAGHLADTPVLVLLIIRRTGDALPDHVREAIAELSRHGLHRIDLDGLDADGLTDLVRARIPSTELLDVDAVVSALLRETAGHPLFADQLLGHWHRSDLLRFVDDAVHVSRPVDFGIPATLRDLVWARVRALGHGVPESLRAAAVLGLEFDERVLATMPGIDGAELPSLLDRAVAAGVLADPAARTRTMQFVHALVASALVADLGAHTLRELHVAAYRATHASLGEASPDLAPRLAYHARAGGLGDEALRWSVRAGDEAMADLAPDEAVRWFALALDEATSLGASDQVRADLLVRLGSARSQTGEPSASATIAEGGRLAIEAGAHDIAVRAAFAIDRGTFALGRSGEEQLRILEYALSNAEDVDTATRALLLALLAHHLIRTGETERRIASATEALELARSTGDRTVFVAVAARVLQALWTPGSGQERMALAREALDAADDLDDPNLVFLVHFATYCAAICAAEPSAATASLDRLHEVADELRDPQMRWAIGVLDAFVATMAGDFADAQPIIDANFELGWEIGVPEAFPVFAAQSFVLGTYLGRHADLLPVVEQAIEAGGPTIDLSFRLAYGIVCFEVGRPQVAADLLREAMRSERPTTPDDFLRSTELLGYAVLALELEDAVAAGWLLPQVVDLSGEVSFNSMTSHGPISAYVGKLASLLGDVQTAERYLLDALEVDAAFGWVYHRATTLIALAENRIRADGRLDAEGGAWLDEADELCRRYGIAGWARRVDRLRASAPS